MAATEAIIKDTVQAGLNLLQKQPDTIDQFVGELPANVRDRFKLYFADSTLNPLVIRDGWQSQVPASPVICIIPGEVEESDQWIGSNVDEGTVLDPQVGLSFTIGNKFTATHHMLIYSSNEQLCNCIGYAVMWTLTVGRIYMENQGIMEARIIRGPTEIAQEFSPPGGGADNVFRTEVHLVHKFQLNYTDVVLGQLLEEIQLVIEDSEGHAEAEVDVAV